MKVKELQNFIISETEKGNLKEDSEVKFTSYMESEWGTINFDASHAKSVNQTLFLSDQEIK